MLDEFVVLSAFTIVVCGDLVHLGLVALCFVLSSGMGWGRRIVTPDDSLMSLF